MDNNQQNAPTGSGNKGIIIAILVVLVAAGVVFAISQKKSSTSESVNTNADQANSVSNTNSNTVNTNSASNTNKASNTNAATNSNTNSGSMMMGKTIEVTVSGSNFKFAPAEIKAKKWDKIVIHFQNDSGFHDLVVPDFSAKTKQFNSPGTETIEFTADKAGTFEFYCSVGSHKALGMKGSIIIEE